MPETYTIDKQLLDRLLKSANNLFNKLRMSPFWGLLEDEPMVQDVLVTLKTLEIQIKSPLLPMEVKPSIPVIWTDQSKIIRCIWSGTHGRCIYEQGKHEHKEELGHAEEI